jgi:hypothetical protein
MKCPGQDPGYWTGEVVFEAPCPKCDSAVEFFKDETSGRCRHCGHRFRNPKVSFDCAQWCAYAEQCLGFVPEREAPSDPGEGALAGRLVRAVKDALAVDQARLSRALRLFQYARELLAGEGGDPRVVLVAATLLEIVAGQAEGMADARRILREIALDQDTADCVCHLLDSFRAGQELDTMEFKIVADADTLVKLAAEDRIDAADRPADIAQLRTTAAKRAVQRTTSTRPETSPDKPEH